MNCRRFVNVRNTSTVVPVARAEESLQINSSAIPAELRCMLDWGNSRWR
jgi:hypothetical protein